MIGQNNQMQTPNNQQYDYKFKLVIVGDGCTGKTTFVKRHASGEYEKRYHATIGVETRDLDFYTNYGKIIYEIWDTAGQEKFGGLRDGYYVDANAAFIFFDYTNKATYNHVENWYRDISRICENIPMVLVGNKIDVKDKKVRLQNVTFHRERNIEFVSISAKSNIKYEEPFLIISRLLLNQPDLRFVQQVATVPVDNSINSYDYRQMQTVAAGAMNAGFDEGMVSDF